VVPLSNSNNKTVVVLGASTNPERYAYKAMSQLKEHGYHVIPVNPAFTEVLGENCFASIRDVHIGIDTLTLYLGAARSSPLIKDIIAAKPRRIIFNPGAENSELATEAQKHGIEVIEGCTLVMLATEQF